MNTNKREKILLRLVSISVNSWLKFPFRVYWCSFVVKCSLFLLICLLLNCCLVVRPRIPVEEPKVAVAILWDVGSIFISSASDYTITGNNKTIKVDANTLVIATVDATQNIVVIKPSKPSVTKERLIIDPAKIVIKSPDDIIMIGNNRQTLSPYRRKVEIKNGVIHRFPVTKNLTAINVLPIEEYLYGVVSCEIGEANEKEFDAIKAQAVCARSYTITLMGKRKDFDVYASYLYDQEYQGKNREYKLAIKAVQETRGEIMKFRGENVLAQYHATCGGRTAPGRYPYLKSIIDAPRHSRHRKPYCKNSPYFEWNIKIPRAAFEDSILKLAGIKYKFKLNPKLDINKITKRVDYLKFKADKEYKLAGESMRKMFNLKSTFFTLKIKNDTAEILGHGWGHGIGMCQYGAMAMAHQGISYKNILKHYYSGVKLKKIY